MNETEHLLIILSEECAEVAQDACKALRFGLRDIKPGQSDDNKRRIERELAELLSVAELLGFVIREEDKAAKRENLKKYMGYSREVGRLDKKSSKAGLLDLIYIQVDGLMKAGKFTELDEMFAFSKDIDPDLMIGLLTASLPVKSKLPSRSAYFKAVSDLLVELGEADPTILQGLA